MKARCKILGDQIKRPSEDAELENTNHAIEPEGSAPQLALLSRFGSGNRWRRWWTRIDACGGRERERES